MKHSVFLSIRVDKKPAAFRRLCVETGGLCFISDYNHPAAFRRLCVETCRFPPQQPYA